MPSIADYVGRTADMAAFQAIAGNTAKLMAQELVRANDGGSMIAGIQKLAQRILMALLTKAGSAPYATEYGTQFISDAQAGLWRTVADVEQSFYSARTDLRRQLQAFETTDDFDDERYGTLDLVGVILSGDKVTLHMNITSLAGTSLTYLAPITVPLH